MFTRRTKREGNEISLDYQFNVPTEHHGQIAVGLRDRGNQFFAGNVLQEGDRNFYRIVGKEPPLETRVNAERLIVFDVGETISVNGHRRSLSEVAEELYAQQDLGKQAKVWEEVWGERILPQLTLWGPVLAGGYAAGLPFGKMGAIIGMVVGLPLGIFLTYAYISKRNNRQRKQDEYLSFADACGRGLLELGIEKGVIPQDYQMR